MFILNMYLSRLKKNNEVFIGISRRIRVPNTESLLCRCVVVCRVVHYCVLCVACRVLRVSCMCRVFSVCRVLLCVPCVVFVVCRVSYVVCCASFMCVVCEGGLAEPAYTTRRFNGSNPHTNSVQ